MGFSQQTLGERADYGTGAGVSILRIEKEGVVPRPKRLDAIARALNVDAAILREAAERQRVDAGAASSTVGARIERLREQDARHSDLDLHLRQLEDARERANVDFLLRLPTTPSRITEIAPSNSALGKEARTEASYRIDLTRSGITHALADPRSQGGGYKGFAAAVEAGAALAAPSLLRSGATVGGLSAVLRISQPTSRLVGGPAVLAATLIAGIVADAVTTSSKRQREEFARKIEAAEKEVAESGPLMDALEALVPEMTRLLSDIAQFAGRALTRWEQRVGHSPDWDGLSPADHEAYRSLVDVAAAQLAIATISLQDLATLRAEDLAEARREAETVLAEAKATIESRV
jgi:transcriptional regulator with XRE-family HTH domain